MSVFGEKGAIITITPEEKATSIKIINAVAGETSEVLMYVNNHYTEKIVAQEVVDMLYIGRTTLMTQFKKHTGKNVHEYVINCRLRNAIKLLSEEKSEYEPALCSGFADTRSLIRCFKRVFGVTPVQYIKKG